MNKLTTLTVVVAIQAGLVGAAVAPQLSARVAGDTYRLRVAPLDPIDPFRGAYVTLDYPDLQRERGSYGEDQTVYVTLVEQDGVLVASSFSEERPEDGLYLTCREDWRMRCGIESLFLPQDKALQMEESLRDGAVAQVRIDGRGNAALIDVTAP